MIFNVKETFIDTIIKNIEIMTLKP